MKHNKLGVYRVGELAFYSKLEAIEMHSKTGIHPHWDFNESVFSSHRWDREPAESLPELYRQRAQQLRDSYDYLVLMYSGGADSTNMLDSFLMNDIPVDEIASFTNFVATGDRDSYLNAEIWRVAIPNLENLKQKHPWIKHRILDLTDMALNYFSQQQAKFDWIYELNSCVSPNHACRESLALKVPEWRKQIEQGKKLAIVWGSDKPRIRQHEDGRFSFHFVDIIDSAGTRKSMEGLLPYTDELFYWTPDLPKIVIKQSHVVKNFLASVDVQKSPWITRSNSGLANVHGVHGVHWLNAHGLHTLIYPTWDINTFTLGKVPSVIFTYRDSWFFDMINMEEIKRQWRIGLEHWWRTLPNYWRNDPCDISKGIKCCISKDYFLQ